MTKCGLLSLLLLNSFAFAQTSWMGLRFGMSEEEVRKAYDGSLAPYERADQNPANFPLADVNRQFEEMPALAVFDFDKKTKGLVQIALIVRKPFEGQREAVGISLGKIEILQMQLAEKYGKPITEEGQCSPTVAMAMNTATLHCDKMWKSEGQSITMSWHFYSLRLQGIFLTYKPLPKDI